ncbi:TetR family transcriptional regulator [Psychromonas sp.]|uniref:TetR family transcriptional regulator n=1 Tax=Psychromonas sp. TaxID=1884585 RepID=UPI0039E2A4D1
MFTIRFLHARFHSEKRTKIIEVATELFVERGYKDLSLDQIVAVCGGSRAKS